jgi:hypothetical protein
MTRQEFERFLRTMDLEKKEAMKAQANAPGWTDQRCIEALVDPVWERRFCDALGLQTESEKALKAAQDGATYQKRSYVASIIAMAIAGISLAISIWSAFFNR